MCFCVLTTGFPLLGSLRQPSQRITTSNVNAFRTTMPERAWQHWLERLYNLRRDKRGSHERPHKPVLLLSILDLIERGQIKANEITLTPDLVNTFRSYFKLVRGKSDQPSIENPFYQLSGDGFWTVEKPGK